MANEQNLIPNSQRSPSEVRELGRKGGKASGRARAYAKSLREALRAEAEKQKDTKDGKGINGFEAIANSMVREAVKGNVQAAQFIAKIMGEDVLKIEANNTIPIQLIDDGLN